MKDFSKYYEQLLGIGYVRQAEINPQLINHCRKYYQRNIIQSKVEGYVKDWDDDKEYHFGIVAQRHPYGEYWSINGQHHAEAALRLGKNVFYYVFDTSSPEEEKAIFDKFGELQKQGLIKPAEVETDDVFTAVFGFGSDKVPSHQPPRIPPSNDVMHEGWKS